MMTIEQFRDALSFSEEKALKWYDSIVKAYKHYFVYSPLAMSHILAQLAHESNSFRTLEENLNYRSPERLLKVFKNRNGLNERKAIQLAGKPREIANFVYGGEWGRRNLGNTEPNDGWHFRGGGLIQLTGRANYKAASDALGIEIERLANLVRTDPDIASEVAMWWLWDKKLWDAFMDDDIVRVTKRINGGTNGLEDRKSRLIKAKSALM